MYFLLQKTIYKIGKLPKFKLECQLTKNRPFCFETFFLTFEPILICCESPCKYLRSWIDSIFEGGAVPLPQILAVLNRTFGVRGGFLSRLKLPYFHHFLWLQFDTWIIFQKELLLLKKLKIGNFLTWLFLYFHQFIWLQFDQLMIL